MKLTESRAALAAMLESATPVEVSIYDHLPDQLSVPAVLVGWASPWLSPGGLCGELDVNAEVVVVAGRLDVAGQADRLDELVSAVSVAIAVDDEWSGPRADIAPYALAIAGVNYLAASLITSALTSP